MSTDEHGTDRGAEATTQPLVLLVRIIGIRLAVLAWGMTVALVQGTALATIIWLSALQRLWHVPVVVYSYIATAALLLNVVGLLVFAILWFRVDPTTG